MRYLNTCRQWLQVRGLLGVEERQTNEAVPSRRKGFLARQEQRRQLLLAIGRKHYRKQLHVVCCTTCVLGCCEYASFYGALCSRSAGNTPGKHDLCAAFAISDK